MSNKNRYHLLSIYYVAAMAVSPLYGLGHIIITQLYEEGVTSAPSEDERPEALETGYFHKVTQLINSKTGV